MLTGASGHWLMMLKKKIIIIKENIFYYFSINYTIVNALITTG